jgi:hypothetical protein
VKNPRDTQGAILKRLLDSDKRAKKRFATQGLEIARYGWAPDYGFEYQTLPAQAFFRAKVALTAEAIKVFGPYLYQNNPHRTVSLKPWADQQLQAKASLIESYLNYTPSEYDYFGNSRRAIDDSLSWGRGVVWTHRHPTKKSVIVSTQDSVRNLWVDGDALSPDSCTRVWRRCVKLRAEAIAEYAQYPEAQKKIAALPKCTQRWQANLLIPGEENTLSGEGVEYYECYSLLPLTSFEGGSDLAEAGAVVDRPQKYVVSAQGELLWSGDWEIPYYLDNAFPCSLLDYYQHPEGSWSVSPLADGLGYQRAINWLMTLMMGKYRFTSRTTLALVNQNEQGIGDADRDKVLMGNDIEAISVKVNGEQKRLQDFIQQFDWSNEWIGASMQMMSVFQERYEKSTGLYGILYAGETPTQVRSATDATMKDRNSQSRINFMRDQIIRWQGEVARKEALGARYLLGRQEITDVMGEEAGKAWGFLIKPEMANGKIWMDQLVQGGLPPEEAMAMVQEKLKDAVDLTKWARETEYDIEPDSLQKPNSDTQVSAFKEMSNQLIPTLVQSVNPQMQALGFEMQAAYLRLIGADAEMVEQVKQLAQMLRTTPPPVVQPPTGQPVA